MGEKLFFMPQTFKRTMLYPDRYSIAPEVIENKFARKVLDKVFSFMVKKGYITYEMVSEYDFNIRKIEIDLDKVDEQIAMNQHAIEAVYNNRVDTIIMGADIMKKIMAYGNPASTGQIEFAMDRPSRFARFSGRGSDLSPKYENVMYKNLHIILVPWFEGFLLLENKEGY